MAAIRHGLSVQDDIRASADGLALPPELIGVLDRTAPVYERVLWPVHLTADQLWINNVSTLNARYGDEIQARLVRALSHTFAPSIRVDVVYETGSFAGGYTDESPPQTVMPSSRTSYNGEASLEMLWHEAAHTGAGDTLVAEIDANVKAQHRAPADQLWHATQFYTVGYVVQDVYHQHGRSRLHAVRDEERRLRTRVGRPTCRCSIRLAGLAARSRDDAAGRREDGQATAAGLNARWPALGVEAPRHAHVRHCGDRPVGQSPS